MRIGPLFLAYISSDQTLTSGLGGQHGEPDFSKAAFHSRSGLLLFGTPKAVMPTVGLNASHRIGCPRSPRLAPLFSYVLVASELDIGKARLGMIVAENKLFIRKIPITKLSYFAIFQKDI